MERVLHSPAQRHGIVGDLREEYAHRRARSHRLACDLWFWRQAVLVYWRFGSEIRRTIPARPRSRLTSDLLCDIRFAVRSLRKRPLFTAVIILTLGIGIGASSAVYSIAHTVLLRELPYDEPDDLVNLCLTHPGWRGREVVDSWWDRVPLSYPEYLDWAKSTKLFQTTAAYGRGFLELTGMGETERLRIGMATASLMEVLGSRLVLGRWFLPGEDGPTAERVAVLSHAFWRERFGADGDVLGRSLTLSDDRYTVIGVLPPGFRLRSTIDWGAPRGFALWREGDSGERALWVPVGTVHKLGRSYTNYEGIGRLARGATVTQALAEAEPILRGDASPEQKGVRMATRFDVETAGLREQIMLLSAGALILLLIACGNVAGLLMSEAIGRRKEIVTRNALGADTVRIVRQLLTESVVVGVLGSVFGALSAVAGIRFLASVAPPLSRMQEVETLWAPLLFACLAGVSAGLLFGLAPALMAGGREPGNALRSTGMTRSGHSIQRAVVTLEIALTVSLLATGGLLTRTLTNLYAVDLGFDPRFVAAIQVQLSPNRVTPQEATSFYSEVLQRIGVAPEIHHAGGTASLPFLGGAWSSSVVIEGRQAEGKVGIHQRIVLPGFFETMGIPLLAGRPLGHGDGAESRKVLVVSESIAKRHFPDGSCIGARLLYADEWWTIVGIVDDVRHRGITREPTSTVYYPYYQHPELGMTLVARTSGDPAMALPTLRQVVRSVSDDVLIRSTQTMTALVSRSVPDEWYRAVLMMVFGLSAATLAAVGVFGATARAIAQRTREMGIRMALGARERGLVGRILWQSLSVGLLGTAAGLLGTFATARFISGFLFGVEAWDPLTYSVVASMLLLVCTGAGYVPARRIADIDPVDVLRAE